MTSTHAKCNGISECFDSSDEISCNRPDDGSCIEEEFTCPDGRCIHVSKVCDFVEDCVEAADEFCEFPSCTDDQYKCASGQCIRLDERCDSFKHCFDESDETNCDVCDVSKAFQCGDRSCISVRLVCDMHCDCPDGSDEMSCDREYKTCEDIWRSGKTNSGYFHIGQSYYIYCNFDWLGKDGGLLSGWMSVQYLNTDWKQLTANTFIIEAAGVSNALHNGYSCSQKASSIK
ncbi:atrial natriuretic peptide-converting enzyme-like [Mercenaria mercenaria]|uniref:atrial natriuretic peptide-converting enzyme-like n=1 Tax=Mercenaria mercenaria TaxID=6596 RepID=UPI00234E39CC|nr:atrial natriuretic peptide-converting enzyme-like [Mercenaria mercenaria]